VRDAGRYGVHHYGELQVDFGAIMERLRRLRADLSANDAVQRFTALGVDVFLGHGGFTGPCALNVEGETLTFARAVIATGCHAGAPPIPGLADSGYLTNESIFALTERPQRLGVIGGGPIGCELAQAFQRLGSQVTLLEADTHLLPREDAEAAAIVHQALCRDGVQVTVGAKIAEVATRGALKIVRHTILMTHKLGLGALTRIIQPYPTQAEAVRKTGDAYQRTRLTPFVKKLMARWFAWQRGR
jgi:pyruvate/2-oxoglutarate dehydrogenase complex dihydrolipoamide dehydrogenase (E3) component